VSRWLFNNDATPLTVSTNCVSRWLFNDGVKAAQGTGKVQKGKVKGKICPCAFF